MADLIVTVVGGFLDLLLAYLPNSPFNTVVWVHDFSTALGWLNWFIDFGRCALLFAAWLAVVVIVAVVRFVIEEVRDVKQVSSV